MHKNLNIERKLSPTEKYFWLIDRKSPSNLTMHARIRGRMNEEIMRRALDGIQARHPLLRVRIARTGWNSASFISGESPPIPLRVLDGPADAWTSVAGEELNRGFQTEAAPLIRSALITHGDGRATILLTFLHSIGDGISGVNIFRDLFAAASLACDGREARLPVLQPKREMEFYLPTWARGMRGRLKHANFAMRTIGSVMFRGKPTLPDLDGSYGTGESRAVITARTLPPDTVEKILERAREYGTTLHSPLIAAQILSIAQDRGMRKPGLFVVGTPVDTRSRLMPELEEDVGFYVAMGVSVNMADINSDFWSLARTVGQSLVNCLERGDPYVYYYQQRYLSWITALIGIGGRSGRFYEKLTHKMTMGGLALGNIGRAPIEADQGHFIIESLGFVASGSDRSPFVSYAGTIDNRLSWNFVGMDPMLSKEHTERLADKAVEILLNALDL